MTIDALEERLAEAFALKANTVPPSVLHELAVPATTPGGSRNRRLVIIATMAAVIVAGVITFNLLVRTSSTGSHITTGTQTAVPTTDSSGDVPAVSTIDTPDTQTVIKIEALRSLVPGTYPFAVLAPDSAGPVVINYQGSSLDDPLISGCMTIATPSPNGSQGTCLAPGTASTELAVTSNDSNTWYFAWTRVPSNAAYVTFIAGSLTTKQQPLDRVAYTTISGSALALANNPPVAQAFDANGTLLGEAHVPQWQIDMGKQMQSPPTP
jgi:hypothetical protein